MASRSPFKSAKLYSRAGSYKPLFAGRAGGANGETRVPNGLCRPRGDTSRPISNSRTFALPVIQIPLDGAGQGHETGGFSARLASSERGFASFATCASGGRNSRCALPPRADGNRFVIAEPDQPARASGSPLRDAASAPRRFGPQATRREVTQTIDARDFLHQSIYAFDVARQEGCVHSSGQEGIPRRRDCRRRAQERKLQAPLRMASRSLSGTSAPITRRIPRA